MRLPPGLTALSIAVLSSLTLLAGCGMEFTPSGPSGTFITPKELPDADRAVAAARSAGKATQCPEAFQEVEKQRYEMYRFYRGCNERGAVPMANDVIAKANALCPVKAQVPPPPPPPSPLPPPPPPPAAPTATLSATPASIQQGACTTLTWSSTGASSATLEPGLGGVAPSGSQQVCPPSTTEYAISASGPGGTARATTTVSVTSPPPPPKVIDRLTIHVNFDFDKSNIRSADVAELQKALDFVNKYRGSKVSIEGHTDGIGTVPYNQALSERRAAAVKRWLVDHGADGSRMQTVGYGKSRPIADNSTPEGRFQNRRVEILIVSE